MRSTYLARLVLVLMMVAAVGVPGLRAVASNADERAVTVQTMPRSDAWTGVLAAPAALAEQDMAAAGEPEPTTPLIVKFRPHSGSYSQMSAHQAAGARRADAVNLANTVRVEVPSSTFDNAFSAYSSRADVEYVEPDYTVHALFTPNDPEFPGQWGPKKVGAETAWNTTRGLSSVKVAVIDCGVFSSQTGRLAGDGQAGHPDLRGKVSANADFTGSANGFDDVCNHGTHVAGIVAGLGNNGIGISGLAPDVTLLNAKVLGDGGSGSSSTIANGIGWAVTNGAKVINMSLGRDGACSQTEQNAINNAWNNGVVVVAAAGNSGLGSSGAPANCANVISVASTTTDDSRSSFSNYGTNVDVAAPGSSIISTVRTGGYASFSGTSMASPHVAALAGLIFSVTPSTTASAVVSKIQTSSTAISGTGTALGSLWAWGRINAAAAVADGTPPTNTPTATATGTAPATNTPTNTPTATPTATAPPTNTPIPVPTFIACPSPRPAVRMTTSPASGTSLNVSVQSGVGVIRQIEFRDLQNGNITIGNQPSAQASFIYVPPVYAPSFTFTVTQQSPSVPTTAGLVVTDDCGPCTTFVGSGVEGFKRGTISGTVRNATTSQPIAGALVSVRGTASSATTNANGVYSLANIGAGGVTVDVTASGYNAASSSTTVTHNQTTTVDATLTPGNPVNTATVYVSLTWGTTPADLDIHLSGPDTGGQRFHTYWNNPTAASHAVLSADAHFGYGPESVALRQNQSTNAWVPGEYRVWAHNYEATDSYTGTSPATITVTRNGQTLASYSATNASGSPTQTLWHAANLTIDANGGVTLAPVQQFLDGGAGSTLRFQDGSSGALQWPAKGKR